MSGYQQNAPTAGNSRAIPWVQSWGALNLNGLVDGVLFPGVATAAATGIANVTLSNMPFPREGGVLNYLTFNFATAPVGVDVTFIIRINNVDNPTLRLVVPAGTSQARVWANIILPAAGTDYLIGNHFTCAAPGAVTTRPQMIVGGLVAKP